jgi:small-conductance mechanosensitive channel
MIVLVLGTIVGMMTGSAVHAAAAASTAAQGKVSSTDPSAIDGEAQSERAAVTLDGAVLFQVRGLPAYPAGERANAIGKRIAAIAADRAVAAESLRVIEMEDRSRIMAGDNLVAGFVDADAAAEGVSRQLLAERVLIKIAAAIASYRNDRSPRVLLINTLYALGATVVLALLLFLFRRAFARLDALAERRLKYQIERLEARSHQLIQAQQLITAFHGLLKFLGALSVLVVAYVYLNLVLALYPWTRPLAARLFEIFFDPLGDLVMGFLDALPNLVFVAVLVIVTRYVLKLTRLYFAGIEQGAITLGKFDRDWALPTYKIARLGIIACALVVGYPHIPGSSSEAFKGVSILIGLVFSLGSSSVIANLIAGYSMIYRRAFKVGDRIMVQDLTGDVTDLRLMVTHLRTVKNEEIVVPNSDLLNSHIINYSTLARSRGLILHTTVGIGYETPWRQVEAMLRLAAERTPGLLKEPAPFILQKSLGDFAVTYELNVYCDDPQKMGRLYTAMHQNVLDVFNEHGVQIMTPAYEGDPEAPKVVPKDQWYLSPAHPTQARTDDGHKS